MEVAISVYILSVTNDTMGNGVTNEVEAYTEMYLANNAAIESQNEFRGVYGIEKKTSENFIEEGEYQKPDGIGVFMAEDFDGNRQYIEIKKVDL